MVTEIFMSEVEEHIEVVLDEPKVEAKSSDEPEIEIKDEKQPELAPDEGINELKKRLDAEKRARLEAERRAQQANHQIQKAYGDVNESNLQLISNAIESAKDRSQILKSAYRESMSVGDYDKAAEVQQAMIENDRNLTELKRGKKALKEKIKDTDIQPVAPLEVDPIERMAQAVSPKSAAWLREVRDVLGDERNIRKMFRAHEDAIDEGMEPDTAEYFQFIEGRIGYRRAEAEEQNPMSAASAPTQKRSVSPPAAPVSRGNGTRPGVIRLTRAQAETARDLGMTEKEYAQQMLALQKEGKLPN